MATRPRNWAFCRPPKKGVCSRKCVRAETSRMRGILPIYAAFARVSLYVPGMNDLTLGAAAAALDAELRRFDQIADLLARLKLDSEKNLDRATRAVQDAAQSEEKVAEAVRDLVGAVARARGRQEEQAKALAERGREVGARREASDDRRTLRRAGRGGFLDQLSLEGGREPGRGRRADGEDRRVREGDARPRGAA